MKSAIILTVQPAIRGNAGSSATGNMLFLDYAATLAVAASVLIFSAMPSALDHLLARTRGLDAESRESCWTQPLIE
jgi:hypothetical protein